MSRRRACFGVSGWMLSIPSSLDWSFPVPSLLRPQVVVFDDCGIVANIDRHSLSALRLQVAIEWFCEASSPSAPRFCRSPGNRQLHSVASCASVVRLQGEAYLMPKFVSSDQMIAVEGCRSGSQQIGWRVLRLSSRFAAPKSFAPVDWLELPLHESRLSTLDRWGRRGHVRP